MNLLKRRQSGGHSERQRVVDGCLRSYFGRGLDHVVHKEALDYRIRLVRVVTATMHVTCSKNKEREKKSEFSKK